MVARIVTLQDTPDYVELIRERIALILLEESAAQVALATAGAVDPEPYRLRVLREHWLPLDYAAQLFEQSGGRDSIVNVSLNSVQIDRTQSSAQACQRYNATFSLDVYSFGQARSDGGTGQIASDTDASLRRDATGRLVRRYMMADDNIYLRMRGDVFGILVTNLEYFLPAVEDHPAPSAKAVRLTLEVPFREFSPGLAPTTLDEVFVDVCTLDVETAEYRLAAEQDFIYPAP